MDPLAATIRSDVERLCALPSRDLGTEGNRAATDYVTERMRAAGLETKTLAFEVPEWRHGGAHVAAGDLKLDMHPGPFSSAVEDAGRLLVIRTSEDIATVDTPGAVLLLCDEIAQTQFTPRGYPFYGNPEHAAILDALEAAHPMAILAATDKSAMTGAMSPFPLIEEVGFAVPTAYMTAEAGALLATSAGEEVAVSINSEVRASTGEQPIGRLMGTGARRLVVSAHVDAKPETPGALDNAAGVAVLLAVAELLGDQQLDCTVEFVPFNGEDHVLAPGEVVWLAKNGDFSDIKLAINIDAPGLVGGPSAYSLYGLDAETTEAVGRVSHGFPDVVEGPQWPASDHMIFAMRGVPAIAVTSEDFETASRGYSHTPKDEPSVVDYAVLANTARFITGVIGECGT